ncbi:serine hydrolase [Azospirillum sp.]|uniref:serine hydrolase domain-containing protein n=1 Tax=Azospirillum sp. TaxID=34012 RepID=UPI002D50B8BD|nr:serine hydrolase [Azospirillum sp.]HYD63958.1 serine hydrolase [Azospirillum sp.]
MSMQPSFSMAGLPADPAAGPFASAASPQDAGFSADLGERLEAGVRSGLLRNLHAVLVLRAGRLALERYFDGPDESWGRPLGTVAMGPDTLHDLRSVTKSIVGLLYGIALERGLVPPPEAPLLAQFPQYPDLAADPARARLTVAHALTMTLGLEWNEDLPYTSPANSEIAMESAPNRYRYVLERPVAAEPGTRWTYCGGATALLGGLIAKGAGRPLPDFAREALFEPLGIGRFEWASGRDGIASAASGLRLTPRDLARIGELILNGGRLRSGELDGRAIVPKAWLDASFTPAVPTGDGLRYGRQWFLGREPVPAMPGPPQMWASGFGNGGQRLWLMPSAGLAVVILCGAYNAPDHWVTPTRVWREIVLPNLQKA